MESEKEEFIILSRSDIYTLCCDEPIIIHIDQKPYVLCSDVYFEDQKICRRRVREK